MKHVRITFLLSALVSLVVFMSCGDDGGTDEPSQQEVLTEALTSKTWSVDATGTNVSNVSGSPDATTFTVTFSDGGNGVINFTLGGDVASYISGGSFTVAEGGGISNLTVTAASGELSANITSVTATETKVTIQVDVTEAAARVSGIGSYTLVFTAS